jgi:arylformamidase
MTTTDYEVEYNNRRRVPDAGAIAERWKVASAAYRETAHAELDLRYGPGDRHRYDLFFADSDAPLVAYVHGGYWQWGDRTLYSFQTKFHPKLGVRRVVTPSFEGHGGDLGRSR